MTRQPFTERLRRGAIGERIIRARLRAMGYVLYSPDPDVVHLVDGLAWSDRRGLFAFEVKTYPARTYYHDQGVNAEHWRRYLALAERLPVVLIWIDPTAGTVHAGKVSDLMPHARHEGKQVYFDLHCLTTWAALTSDEQAQLRTTPQRIVIGARSGSG